MSSSTRSESTSTTPDRGVGQPMARILLIEDSPTDAAVLTQLLERNGHEVLSSGSAEDGIEVCKRELPDLVLMDRSEEHTSELQSLMRSSYAVFRLKKKNTP